MAHWSLEDIDWQAFDAAKVAPELLPVIKAASLVEHNGDDYARYLCEVFHDDAAFQEAARQWAQEEVQHGKALRRWAELADAGFDFDKSFAAFTSGYQLPAQVDASVRGSRTGELIARCVVEMGTSSYYTAIREYAQEPVLQAICARIAADELRHYKLFYQHLQRYLEIERIGLPRRIMIALSRIAESEDDELAYAFFAANDYGSGKSYNRDVYKKLYLAHACRLYRRPHLERMVAMVFKAVGLKPHTWLHRAASRMAWLVLQLRGSATTSLPRRSLPA